MKLIDCRGRELPEGAVYIGRKMPGFRRSRLANPFTAKSRAPKRCTGAVVVPDKSVLERYRRHLTSAVIEGFVQLAALRELGRDATLSCWCAEREAVRVGLGHPEPATPCHGDVIFTVWLMLERLDWKVSRVSFQEDYAGASRAWAELYERAFGVPLLWGRGAAC